MATNFSTTGSLNNWSLDGSLNNFSLVEEVPDTANAAATQVELRNKRVTGVTHLTRANNMVHWSPREFAAPANQPDGMAVIPILYPVAYDELLDKYVAWEEGGANGRDEIVGLLYPREADLNASRLHTVLTRGVVDINDIPAIITTALETALTVVQGYGDLYIEGL